jgi:hypothetical protein
MSTFRRRVGDTRYDDPSPHVQHWRAANDEDDALSLARGVVNAIVYSLLLYAVAGGLWLALVVLMGWS